MTPINCNAFMRDLIQQFSLPVILVASSRLGTINHTLLSLEALRANNIQILGVIVSGELNQFNCNAIEDYGNIKVLAQVPFLNDIKSDSLREVMLTEDLKKIVKL